jgi:glycosyltransferase involved in cell wall biosynthesis
MSQIGIRDQSVLPAASRRLWFVVPCFNEQEVLPTTLIRLTATLDQLIDARLCDRHGSGLLFIDDGSTDDTWHALRQAACQYPAVRAIRLSRNCGHQTALLAGILNVIADADCCISVDADLQDDLSICPQMLMYWAQGVDIVYGVRYQRSVDNACKRLWASLFYLVSPLLGLQGIYGHADFRLLSSRVLRAIADYPERTLYLRGLIPLMGFNTATIAYERKRRSRGTTKYPFRKSLSLAIDGIISLSAYPLRLIAWFGLFAALGSFFFMLALLIRYFMGGTVHGWTSIMVVIVAATGVQMLALGVIGEYLSRIYREVKGRPRFHIQEHTGLQL